MLYSPVSLQLLRLFALSFDPKSPPQLPRLEGNKGEPLSVG